MTDKTEAQPEALRLADEQEAALLAVANGEMKVGKLPLDTFVRGYSELRRQHTEIQQLKAQPSARQAAPNPWQQAIDHELVCLHLGVAGEATKESALKALQELIQCHVEIAINPQTNGGLSLQPHREAQTVPDEWRLAPFKPTPEMINAGVAARRSGGTSDEVYMAMLSAAPPPPERETGKCPECGDTHCPRAQNHSWPCVPNPLRKRSHQ